MSLSIVVAEQDAEQRLDRWLRRNVGNITQSRLERMCRRGLVRVDGQRVKCSTRLASGQVVKLPQYAEERDGEPVMPDTGRLQWDLASATVYEDEHYIAVNKPSGLATQGGSGQRVHLDLLLSGATGHDGNRLRLIHRLDKDTSGVLLLGKTVQSVQAMARMFGDRSIAKHYMAVTVRKPDRDSGSIRLDLGRQSGNRHGVGWRSEDGLTDIRSAWTEYRVIETCDSGLTLVSLEPVTGRKHQLRAHMASVGCPIAGDARYGLRTGNDPSCSRLHLHACRLTFTHPFRSAFVDIRAPFPDHMLETCRQLGWDLDVITDSLWMGKKGLDAR